MATPTQQLRTNFTLVLTAYQVGLIIGELSHLTRHDGYYTEEHKQDLLNLHDQIKEQYEEQQ